MAGFGDIFGDTADEGIDYAAPGVPVAALSGNPWATLGNLKAIGGAEQGAAIGGAIAQAIGGPKVDPAQIRQRNQADFVTLYENEMASGEKLMGQAFMDAAKLAYKGGILSPDQYLVATSRGSERLEKDRAFLEKATTLVNKSDAFKNYSASVGIFRELQETVKRGKYGSQSANDFVLIQQGLKILDPGSIVSQNEMQQGRFAANGAAQLRIMGVDLNAITRAAAGNGKNFELTKNQKEKWLKAISAAVDSQRNNLESTVLAAKDAYTTSGGSENIFLKSIAATQDLLTKSAYNSTDELAAAGLISGGRGFDDPIDQLNAGLKNFQPFYGRLFNEIGKTVKDVGVELLFGLFGSDEPEPPKGNAKKGKRDNAGRPDRYVPSIESGGKLGRLLSPASLNKAMQTAYQTDNPVHAQIFDTLNGDSVGNVFDAFQRGAIRQSRKA